MTTGEELLRKSKLHSKKLDRSNIKSPDKQWFATPIGWFREDQCQSLIKQGVLVATAEQLAMCDVDSMQITNASGSKELPIVVRMLSEFGKLDKYIRSQYSYEVYCAMEAGNYYDLALNGSTKLVYLPKDATEYTTIFIRLDREAMQAKTKQESNLMPLSS